VNLLVDEVSDDGVNIKLVLVHGGGVKGYNEGCILGPQKTP
jgi:hypothetical protein